ncbi:TPA: restriction endonuclease subunit S [Clostridium botulinum]|nr:restriction endonuclease subunit S [Clostridium botulinum]HCL4456142.1 restriction endonuclease subunit S [Clostridium botulinum]HCL4459827.1 restriction endonuclease subunit S [Clostridium botulinum]HCL4470881.1 restriction endonuclease subunit S [Clostridium botulinum]HCL4474483.1 restriction endonuclease subunit S [Clostridium botulinum]
MEYIILKDICIDIKDGNWIESKDQSKEGIRLIQTGNIGNRKYIDKENKAKFISEETFQKLKCTEIFEGDVLISRLPSPVGRACLFPKIVQRAITAVDCTIVKFNKKICIPEYFLYYTASDMYMRQIEKSLVGTTRLRISRKKLENIKIYLPNIGIQEKAVNVLDKVQSLIEKRKAQIEALDELVKSRFMEMFGNPIINSKGWKTELLGNVCEMKAGKNIKASDICEENLAGLYPCYGGNGLRGYVKEYSHEGNIPLIGRQGALCGNVKYARGKFYATEHAVATNPKMEMNTYWLYFMLSELDLNRLSTGAAQPGLTIGKLNEVEFPMVPMELQNRFEKFANEIDKLKFEMERSLKELENNFNSLMQKAFKGELFN